MPDANPNIAALVEQMPETDKDIQIRQEQAKANAAQPDASDKTKQLGAASKVTGPDPDATGKIFQAILAGGRESVLELLGLVREPVDADFKNYKAGYVLHGLVILAGRAGNESQRRLLNEVLASQLGNNRHSKAVMAYFIRELRILGDREAVAALGTQLLDNDLGGDAAQALLTIREGAAAPFRDALKRSAGKNRLTIIQALGELRDTESAAALRSALTDQDRDVRRTAAWALANLGDASSIDPLLKGMDTAEGWDRTEATNVCFLLAERLGANARKSEATRVYQHLRDTRSERHIREAAERGLAALK